MDGGWCLACITATPQQEGSHYSPDCWQVGCGPNVATSFQFFKGSRKALSRPRQWELVSAFRLPVFFVLFCLFNSELAFVHDCCRHCFCSKSFGWQYSHIQQLLHFLKNIYLFMCFIYLFWLHQVLVAARGIFIAACGLLSWGMHAGSSSPTRDGTQAPCIGSAESYPLDHQGSPNNHFI